MPEERWGLLLLDKPVGLTSHTAIRRAGRALGIKKTGHAGTLDPLASGLMLVGLGRGTRLLEFLVGLPKCYTAKIKLGVATDTLDREGIVTEEAPFGIVTEDAINEALKGFVGEIEQIPPIHSAIKKDGVPLHRRARRGEEVVPEPRRVTIHSISLKKIALPYIELEANVSSGTYIRSLARDIGEELGTKAALWELRRTSCGPFGIDDSVTIEDLENGAVGGILPPEKMVPMLPSTAIDSDDAKAIATGAAIDAPGQAEEGSRYALFNREGNLLAVARVKDGKFKPRKVFI
ncbi:MAG: tRNA pseudouridine(55) synthase TruB [Deltaproteobacteria bacterium]|nr:MAG: tRNA pseudouridine(55) synthase TruB [Deltaproteobacteria bacterium]